MFFPFYFSREWKLNQKFSLSHLVCENNDLEKDLVSLLGDQDQVSQPLCSLQHLALGSWRRRNFKKFLKKKTKTKQCVLCANPSSTKLPKGLSNLLNIVWAKQLTFRGELADLPWRLILRRYKRILRHILFGYCHWFQEFKTVLPITYSLT